MLSQERAATLHTGTMPGRWMKIRSVQELYMLLHHDAVMKISVMVQTKSAGKNGFYTWQSRKIGTEKVCTYFLLKNTAK